MADTVACPPGWYYCRVKEGDMHIARYPIAAWRAPAGQPVTPLIAKPGESGLVPPSNEDRAGLVGLCPPDREYQSYFAGEDIQDAARRLFHFLHPQEAKQQWEASVREVQMPGVGAIPVRDARPEAQRQSSDWMKRAWGETAQPRLGGAGSNDG